MSEHQANIADSAAKHKDAKDLAQGALINYLGMLAQVSKVVFMMVVAQIYGVTALGLYLLAWNGVDLASKFGLWGIDRSLIRDIARFNIDQTAKTRSKIFGILRFNIGMAIGLSLIATFVMFHLSETIALSVFKEAGLVTPLKILSLALPFVVLTHVFLATTKALRIMRYEVLIRKTFEPLILLVMTLALIPLNMGAVGLVLAHMVASIATTGVAGYVLFRKYQYLGWHREPLPKNFKKETLRYTSPIAAMDFLNLMVARIDVMLVGAFVSATAAGFYGIAVEIISVIKRVRQGFEPIFSPIVSELYYSKQKVRLKRNYVLVTRWLMAGSLLPVIAIVLFPAQLLVLFNEEATKAAGVLVVLAISHGLFGSFSAAESLLLMTGKSLVNTGLAAAMLAINVVASLLLLPAFGMLGVALGMLVAYTFVSTARVLQGYKLFQLHPFGHALLWPLVTATMTAASFYAMSRWWLINSLPETVAVLIVLAGTYATIYFLGAKEPEEKHLISRLKNKIRRAPIVLST